MEPVIRMRPLLARPHVAADFLDQVDRADDVGVHHLSGLIPVLVQEAVAQPTPGIGQQRLNRAASGRRMQRVHALRRGQVRLHGTHGGAQLAELLGSVLDRRLVSGDQKVKAFPGAALRKRVADSGGGAGDDGKGTLAGRYG